MAGTRDTVFALSSASGKAGISVVRLSGAAAKGTVHALTGKDPPLPRRATLVKYVNPETKETIDRGLLLWFPAPASFTGEDMAELHVHGGRAVLDALFAALVGIEEVRPAEPGEFTRRAFDAGKLDLTEVEGLADLIDAETEAQRRQAVRQMEGALGALYSRWRSELVRALAHLEAAIDFADEDVPEDLRKRAMGALGALRAELRAHLDAGTRGLVLRDGFEVAIVGAPNVGKSSLINAIARREVAIVSELSGTTRDVIEVRMNLGGYPVILADTAGIRSAADLETLDPVECEGVRRALSRAERADLTVVVVDGSSPDLYPALDDRDAQYVQVVNKCDLKGASAPAGWNDERHWFVSAKTGVGLEALLVELSGIVETKLAPGGGVSMTRARHRKAVEGALDAIERARTADALDLATEDVRIAARELGRLVGVVDVEDVLDVIFADFCIGK